MTKFKTEFLCIILILFLCDNLFSQDINKKVDDNSQHPEKELHRVTTGDKAITAIWMGKDPNVELERSDMPLTFGVKKLLFEFSNTKQRIVFKPTGELYFSDWSFNIFSPNQRFVILLQSHYGPYHVIPVESLMDYLLGNNSLIEIVSGRTPDGPGVIHGEIIWLSSDTFKFGAACCGGGYMVVHQIGGKTKYGKWKAGEKHLE